MIILVNDANILIDMVELQILDQFFTLDYKFYTNTLILDELLPDQQIALQPFIDSKILIVEQMQASQLQEIKLIERSKPKLSFQDCSAYHQTKVKQGILLTCDNVLRKFAMSNHINTHGHLWILDELVNQEKMSSSMAACKLRELSDVINIQLKLSKEECEKRYKLWNK